METPLAYGLSLDLGPSSSQRRSPFSPNNAITTEWKSDPSKTNDLLRDIARVLQSPVPSPEGCVRKLDSELQTKSSVTPNQSGQEQSAKELVASLEKLLQKSPSVDGQTALLSLRADPQQPSAATAPQHAFSSPLAPSLAAATPAAGSPAAAAAGGSHSRWQFLANKASSFKSPAASFRSPAASPAASPTAPSVAALLDQLSSITSPSASAAASPAASPPYLAAAGLEDASRSLAASPYSSPPAPAPLAATYGSPSSPAPLGNAAKPALSRWQSIAAQAAGKAAGSCSPGGGTLLGHGLSPLRQDSHRTSDAATPVRLPAMGASAAPLLHIDRVVLQLPQLSLVPAAGLRFEQQAAKVMGELSAYATLDATMTAQFQAAVAEQMGRLFTLPS